MERGKYTVKCLNMLNSNQFKKLDQDPTKAVENKIKRALRKIKYKLSKQDYIKLYPTGSASGEFYGTVKKHKMPINGTREDLPLCPIVSNIGTASYHLAKHLAKILSPFSKSEYTVDSTTDFIKCVRKMKIPAQHKVISFDGKALFTNVPLDHTINLIIKRTYDNHKINTNISRKEMKDLLILCTKNVHFSLDGQIYIQCDGVAVGSSIGPMLAGSFMVELERTLIPQLCEHMISWERFVDDTITSIKPMSIPYVINVLHSFHSNIELTYEEEKDGQIPFLDVLLVRKNDTFETTNNGIYLHWNSFAPNTSKCGTLRSIITRAYDVCSNDEFLKQELSKTKADFSKINGCPKWIFDQIHQKVIEHREVSKEISKNDENNSTESATNNTNKVHIIS